MNQRFWQALPSVAELEKLRDLNDRQLKKVMRLRKTVEQRQAQCFYDWLTTRPSLMALYIVTNHLGYELPGAKKAEKAIHQESLRIVEKDPLPDFHQEERSRFAVCILRELNARAYIARKTPQQVLDLLKEGKLT